MTVSQGKGSGGSASVDEQGAVFVDEFVSSSGCIYFVVGDFERKHLSALALDEVLKSNDCAVHKLDSVAVCVGGKRCLREHDVFLRAHLEPLLCVDWNSGKVQSGTGWNANNAGRYDSEGYDP